MDFQQSYNRKPRWIIQRKHYSKAACKLSKTCISNDNLCQGKQFSLSLLYGTPEILVKRSVLNHRRSRRWERYFGFLEINIIRPYVRCVNFSLSLILLFTARAVAKLSQTCLRKMLERGCPAIIMYTRVTNVSHLVKTISIANHSTNKTCKANVSIVFKYVKPYMPKILYPKTPQSCNISISRTPHNTGSIKYCFLITNMMRKS